MTAGTNNHLSIFGDRPQLMQDESTGNWIMSQGTIFDSILIGNEYNVTIRNIGVIATTDDAFKIYGTKTNPAINEFGTINLQGVSVIYPDGYSGTANHAILLENYTRLTVDDCHIAKL